MRSDAIQRVGYTVTINATTLDIDECHNHHLAERLDAEFKRREYRFTWDEILRLREILSVDEQRCCERRTDAHDPRGYWMWHYNMLEMLDKYTDYATKPGGADEPRPWRVAQMTTLCGARMNG